MAHYGRKAWAIEAYTYEADTHCIACTVARWRAGGFKLQADHAEGDATDEHGLPYAAEDNEGNPVHPVFANDEGAIDETGRDLGMICGTCGDVIRDPDPDDEEPDDASPADDGGLDFDILARIGRNWQG